MLDANGFRPARYVVVTDNKEGTPVGVFTVSEDSLSDEFLEQYGFYAIKRGKLEAGEVLNASGDKVKLTEEVFEDLADPEKNGGIDYEAIWKDWVKKIEKPDLKKYKPTEHNLSFVTRLYASMHDRETHKFITNPSVEQGKTPYGAMGADGVIDALYDSAVATHPANLFKQLFAQITNPAIDALKEMDSFSLTGLSGPNPLKNFKISEDGKKFIPKDENYNGLHSQIEHDNTFNYPGQLDIIKKEVGKKGYVEIDATFEIIENEQGGIDVEASKESYFRRIKEIEAQVEAAVRNGAGHVILSDNNIGIGRQAIPDLRILKAVKSHLEDAGLSMDASVHVESQQVKDAHHYSVLKALGASTVEAPLLFEVIHQGFKDNLKEFRNFETVEDAFKAFSKAVNYEYLKIMAKFGITNNSNYENGLLLEGFGIDTKGNSYDGDFNDIYSEFGGKVDEDLALDAIRAYEGAISRDAAYIPLKKIIDSVIKENLDGREYNSKVLYPAISKHFDALRHATFIEDDKERLEFTNQVTSMILVDSGILTEEDYKSESTVKDFSVFKLINDKVSSSSVAQEILNVVRNIQKPNPELVDHGRFGMRHDSKMKHRFGEEYVKHIGDYYSSLEAKREPVINELMEKYEVEVRKDKGILIEAKERLIENFKQENIDKSYISDREREQIIKEIYSELGTGEDAKKAISDKFKSLKETRLNANVFNFKRDLDSPIGKAETAVEAEKIIQEKLLERRGYLGKNLLGVEYMDILPGGHPKDFQIVPRDEDGRIDKEWIKNYQNPSPEYQVFSEAYKNEKDSAHYTFREFLSFKSDRPSVKIEDFKDNVLDIIQNHHRAAQISYGALTLDAWTTANVALNNLHGNPSSGEGNEPTQKMGTKEGPKNTQLASGRNNTNAAAMQVRALYGGHMQIKVVQPGAKPGEGGSAPERKMEILKAALRGVLPWTQQDSPAPLHDSYSIEELKQIVYDAKSFIHPETGKPIEVDVKIGATKGVAQVALGAYKCGVDIITIGGHEGGTAAAGRLSSTNTTQDWVLGVKALQELQKQGVRDQVKVFVEGGIGSDDDMLLALALGYDGVGQGTALMIQNKCIMARVCNKQGITEKEYKKYQEKFKAENGYDLHELDTKAVMELVGKQFCPVGVANSDYLYKSEGWRIEQFQLDQSASLRNKIAELGYNSIKEFRDAPLAEKLEFIKPVLKDRVGDINVDFLFEEFERAPSIAKLEEEHKRLDDKWLPELKEHLEQIKSGKKPNQLVIDAGKIDPCSGRSVGARSAGLITQHTYEGRHEMEIWPDRVAVGKDEVIKVITVGSAGLSYGVYATNGMHLHNIGPLQNDVGKDADGGVISACFELPKNHPCPEKFWEQEQVIAGNNIGYGNKGADIYLAGKVGSRATICNKGGVLVVEGTGEYQCEFMTSGTFINLSDELGLGAFNGMKGGLAFQYNKNNNFDKYADKSSVRRASPEERELFEVVLKTELENHYKYTGSRQAKEILENFEAEKENFVFAIPKNYEKFQSLGDLKDVYDYENLRKTEVSVGDNAIHEAMRLTKAQQIIANSADRDLHIALGKQKINKEGSDEDKMLANSKTIKI
jgi:glutamate synthase domain-containing protein 2/glutamate synthase domain-containing protein 3